MTSKLVDRNSLWARLFISLFVSVVSFAVLSQISVAFEKRFALTVVAFALSFLFTFLDGMVRGIEAFKDAVDRSVSWLAVVSDYAKAAELEIDKLLSQLLTIRDKVVARPGSAYAATAKHVVQTVIYQLTELANDEFRTTGQSALESYITFIDGLEREEHYLATSAVGVPNFWQDAHMGQRAFDANKRAIATGVKITRIFVLPDVKDADRYRAVRDEAIKHRDSGIDVIVVLENSLPRDYRRDFGIFNSRFVAYFELGPRDSFLGIRYYFSDKEVENALRLYSLIKEADALRSHGHKSLEELFESLEKPAPG